MTVGRSAVGRRSTSRDRARRPPGTRPDQSRPQPRNIAATSRPPSGCRDRRLSRRSAARSRRRSREAACPGPRRSCRRRARRFRSGRRRRRAAWPRSGGTGGREIQAALAGLMAPGPRRWFSSCGSRRRRPAAVAGASSSPRPSAVQPAHRGRPRHRRRAPSASDAVRRANGASERHATSKPTAKPTRQADQDAGRGRTYKVKSGDTLSGDRGDATGRRSRRSCAQQHHGPAHAAGGPDPEAALTRRVVGRRRLSAGSPGSTT